MKRLRNELQKLSPQRIEQYAVIHGWVAKGYDNYKKGPCIISLDHCWNHLSAKGILDRKLWAVQAFSKDERRPMKVIIPEIDSIELPLPTTKMPVPRVVQVNSTCKPRPEMETIRLDAHRMLLRTLLPEL
jgi:hypothetical protein